MKSVRLRNGPPDLRIFHFTLAWSIEGIFNALLQSKGVVGSYPVAENRSDTDPAELGTAYLRLCNAYSKTGSKLSIVL